MMPSTGRRGARRGSLSYDAAVTLDQSGRCTGRQAGWQAAAHSRGNDTALLLWERPTERARRDGIQRGQSSISFSCALTLRVVVCHQSAGFCHGGVFLSRPPLKSLKSYFLNQLLTMTGGILGEHTILKQFWLFHSRDERISVFCCGFLVGLKQDKAQLEKGDVNIFLCPNQSLATFESKCEESCGVVWLSNPTTPTVISKKQNKHLENLLQKNT